MVSTGIVILIVAILTGGGVGAYFVGKASAPTEINQHQEILQDIQQVNTQIMDSRNTTIVMYPEKMPVRVKTTNFKKVNEFKEWLITLDDFQVANLREVKGEIIYFAYTNVAQVVITNSINSWTTNKTIQTNYFKNN